ncbi:MAG: hypothetical protein QNK37_30860 [Acidobacteriota bacterium]|nr:hypothetical protein [Acidobacteriota bacterium]
MSDSIRGNLHDQGYDKEAEYFKRLEKEQIEKMREKLKKEEEEADKKAP